jgi:hypothetical protein
MFGEFMKLAVPLAIVGIIASSTANDVASLLIPVTVVGTVIYVLSHVCRGFERADRRRNRF